MVFWLRQLSSVSLLALVAGSFMITFVVAQHEIEYVSTPEAFQAAAQAGVPHIILKDHMDLRELSADPISNTNSSMVINKRSTKSIRGNCAGVPAPADLETTLDPPRESIDQCIIVAAAPLLEIYNAATLLLSDVYIMLKREAPDASALLLPLISIPSGSLWMTNSVLRGDVSNCRGVHVGFGQHFHSSNCRFADFQAEGSAAVRCKAGSRAGFKDCLFMTNAVRYHGSSVGLESGNARDIPAAAWFPSCIFSSNDDRLGYPISQSDSRASHFSNRAFQKSVVESTGNLIVPKPINATKLNDTGFLVAQSSTFKAIADEQAFLTNLTTVDIMMIDNILVENEPEDISQGGSGERGLSTAAICGVVGGLLVAVIAAVMLLARHRRKRGGSSKHNPAMDAYGGNAALKRPAQILRSDPWHSNGGAVAVADTSPQRSPGNTPTTVITENSHWETDVNFKPTAADLSCPLPPASAPTADRMRYLHAQLSSIGKEVVLEQFTLLGASQRRQGGQAVVAFALGAHDSLEYALKFFLDRRSFLAERNMYRSRTLGSLLPQVQAEHDPEVEPHALNDSMGRPLPPCIVMERGEALPDWSKRAKPDVFQAVSVLAHVATRLLDMHEGGYVHRDIKPGNIMLLPRANRWTVIDFGCAASVGESVPLAYTLVYAAPEVAAAMAVGHKSIVVSPAVDAWALGVVAFELLTGQSAFNLIIEGRDSVMGKLLGREELPWEGDLAQKNPAARLRLGLFREPVLSLLHRDPAQRATLATFCHTTNTVFSSPTTVEAA